MFAQVEVHCFNFLRIHVNASQIEKDGWHFSRFKTGFGSADFYELTQYTTSICTIHWILIFQIDGMMFTLLNCFISYSHS